MFKLEVIYPADRADGQIARSEKRALYEERRSKNLTEALEETFQFCKPELSIGDVVKVIAPMTKYYICEAVHWTEVPEEYATQWIQKMTDGQVRRKGLAHCIEHKLFPAIPLEDGT